MKTGTKVFARFGASCGYRAARPDWKLGEVVGVKCRDNGSVQSVVVKLVDGSTVERFPPEIRVAKLVRKSDGTMVYRG